MGYGMDSRYQPEAISSWWHLCDELTVEQASLLLLGIDPEQYVYDLKPSGFNPVFSAISGALAAGNVKGRRHFVSDINGEYPDDRNSVVEVASLKEWLLGKGVTTGFFFPGETASLPGYLDPSHERYAPKLAAAIKAWQAMEDANLYAGRSPKGAMVSWLKNNYRALGLAHKQDSPKNGYRKGDINNAAIVDAAKIANWREDGGAPKTPENRTPLRLM